MRQQLGVLEADRSVRLVYREVLRVAAALGLGRQPAETPDEYALRLEGAAGGAGAASDLAALTAAYDQARYGETELVGEQQREARARGERLRCPAARTATARGAL